MRFLNLTTGGILGLVFMLLVAPQAVAEKPAWMAGVARARVTPQGSYWMAGYASRNRPSEGTRQDLYAKAIAIDDPEGSRIVIVTMDLLVVPSDLAKAIGRRVQEQHQLPPERLLLNCSHTHCGPELRLYRETLHDIPGVYAAKMKAYVKSLEGKLVDLVGEAIRKQRPATISTSQSSADFAINRRDNRESEVAERRKSSKLRGPTDHGVPVMRVADQEGRLMAILFGYACHNTVLSFYETCGDYAGYAQQYVEENHPTAQAMFVMGAGGDQNPWPRRQVEHAQQHGRSLADAVERALKSPQRQVAGDLRVARANAPLRMQPPPDVAALKKQATSSNKYQRWKANYLLEELAAGREISQDYPLPVQAALFGDDLLLVAIGGETVVDYSLRVKEKFEKSGKGPHVWVAGYSNDVFGYLPSLRVLKEGGYEGGGHMVYTKFPGPFTDSVEQRVMETIQSLVDKVDQAR